MKASNRKIIAAYFDAGVIYKEQLEDIPQAIQSPKPKQALSH